MQAAREKYRMPGVPSFTQSGRVGHASVGSSFNSSHDMSTHSSSSSRALSHREQSPITAQHHLQQQLQQQLQPVAHPSQDHAQQQEAQLQPASPAAQRQQQAYDCQNDSPNQAVRLVQQRPAGSDTLITPSKAPDEINDDVSVAANKSLATEAHDGLAESSERSGCGSRWPREETLALLKLRSDMDSNFRDTNLKGPLWEEVSR